MESHNFVGVSEVFTFTLRRADEVAISREANTTGIVLEGDEQTKLKCPTSIMATSKTFGKLPYKTCLKFFDQWNGSMSWAT